MVKVNIISGFLGAGKTTLIKKLLTGSVAKEKIILLENEYGEVGVDGSFMKDSGIIVDELNSGCICCTLVGDFQKAVDELIAKYHPDRLLIEPSGVGKLSEILAAVERAKERHSDLVVTGCATVVDAGKCRMYMKNFGEFFLDQIKTSATVIFSRTQLLSAERIEKSRALVEEQHPGVRIVTTPWDDLSADTLLEVIESGKPMEIHLDDDDDDDDEDEHEHHHHHEDGEECCCHHHHDDDHDEHEHHHHHDHDDHDEDEHEHHHHDHEDGETCSCGHHHHHHHGHDADEVFVSVGVETANRYEQDEVKAMLDKLSDEEEYGTVLRRQGQQLIVELGHHGLIGGDNMLAGQNGIPNIFPGGVKTADGLHHGINGWVVQNILKIMGNLGIGQGQLPPAQHPHHLHILPGGGQLIYTFAYSAKTQ